MGEIAVTPAALLALDDVPLDVLLYAQPCDGVRMFASRISLERVWTEHASLLTRLDCEMTSLHELRASRGDGDGMECDTSH